MMGGGGRGRVGANEDDSKKKVGTCPIFKCTQSYVTDRRQLQYLVSVLVFSQLGSEGYKDMSSILAEQ